MPLPDGRLEEICTLNVKYPHLTERKRRWQKGEDGR